MNYRFWIAQAVFVILNCEVLGSLTSILLSPLKFLHAEKSILKLNFAILKGHKKQFSEMLRLLARPAIEEISMKDVIFTLYTRSGPSEGVKVEVGNNTTLVNGKFDSSKPTYIATHGFLNSGDTEWMKDLKKAQLEAVNSNVIIVDWGYCAYIAIYSEAVNCTTPVAKYVAALIKFLVTLGADLDTIHLMGHSLGAQVMGQVSAYGPIVGRITGFDPAGPLFYHNNLTLRLDPSDAKVVDVIHTDIKLFGYSGRLGHYDFFPSGGYGQPDCLTLNKACDHSKSYEYYIKSLYKNKKFPGIRCDSIIEAMEARCFGPINFMGVASAKGAPGIYYVGV